jgi:hypothetical protein
MISRSFVQKRADTQPADVHLDDGLLNHASLDHRAEQEAMSVIALEGSAAAGLVVGWRPAWAAALCTGALALEALLLAGPAAAVAGSAGGATGGLLRTLGRRRIERKHAA